MSPVFRHGRLRLYLLKLLDESPRHGYEVIRLLQDRFMGVYAPSPGTIYPRLARLEEEGLVTHDEAGGRKVYRITDKGREELRNRSGDLSELEEEITASVRDIAREVTEDVRETVRNLREELTFAARDMHRRGYAEPPGRARAGSRARSRSAWDVAQQEADEAGQDRGEAGWEHDEARRERDEARRERDQARQERYRERDEARRERHRERDEARRERDEARRERDEARRERDEARRERSGWPGWPPGAGWADPGSYRDLEQLARHFTRELRDAAAAAQAVSEEAVGDLRTILDDALDRIKAEVFGSPGTPRSSGPHSDRPHQDD
jgi:DNA-binding PadR family transcriptional regulator